MDPICVAFGLARHTHEMTGKTTIEHRLNLAIIACLAEIERLRSLPHASEKGPRHFREEKQRLLDVLLAIRDGLVPLDDAGLRRIVKAPLHD